jgi:hypothetical protein
MEIREDDMSRKTLLTHAGILVVIALIGFGPLLLSLSAGAFANLNGCTLHEGFANPCVFLGVDWGDTLYSLGVMGWGTLLTLPVAFFFLLIYLGVMLFIWIRNRREMSATK